MKKSQTESKAMEAFTSLMIEKIKAMQHDWKKPWVMPGFTGMPQNISGREYNGFNSLMLMMLREDKGYQTPVFMTFQQAKKNGWDVKKGESGFPVELWSHVIKDKNNKKITQEEYNNLSEDEQTKCKSYPVMKTYIVFNVEQTRLPELEPEKWQAMLDRFAPCKLREEEGMLRSPELDYMLDKQTWVCPIKVQTSDSAHYSPVQDHIVVPLKAQFDSGERFYGTLLHEMAHSTGHDDRLARELKNGFGTPAYGREELVAEMTAALTASQLGISKGIQEENVAYLQGWLKNISEKPEFLRTVMSDVNKASSMIQEKVLTEEMANDIKEKAIASIDKFIQEKEEQKQQTAPTVKLDELKQKIPSIAGAHLSLYLPLPDTVNETVEKSKKNAPGVQAWVIQDDRVFVVGDDARAASRTLKLNTSKMLDAAGEQTDVLVFDRQNLSVYLPQAVRKGLRVAVTETPAEVVQQKQQQPEPKDVPKLHMAALGNGITVWEEGDNDYTAHISQAREIKTYKDFHPVNLEKLKQMAESGNLLQGNKNAESLALKPVNLASRFISQPYGMQMVPVSCEKVGNTEIICNGQTVVRFKDGLDMDARQRFDSLPKIHRPDTFIVSVTGIDKMRDSLVLMQRSGIDTAYLQKNMFLETLSIAEETLSSTEKQFRRIYFKVENQGTAEKPERAITAFCNDEGLKGMDPENSIPRYYMRDNAIWYNQPSEQEVQQGLSTSRMVLSQDVTVRVKGRDNILNAMQTLARQGVNFTPMATEMAERAYEEGQARPRAVADKDFMYFEVRKGMVHDMMMNIVEYAIAEDDPILEVAGGQLRQTAMQDSRQREAYLVVGYNNGGEVTTFTKVQGGEHNLADAQKMVDNLFDKGLERNNGVTEWRIVQVDNTLRESTQYQMMDVTALKQLMDEHPYSFTVQQVIDVQTYRQRQDEFINTLNNNIMGQKTTEQVNEPQVKEQDQKTANEQQASKQIREGVHVFQRRGKDGNAVPGIYGVMVVKDGVKSDVATLSKEDRDQYFKDVKGKTGEEAENVRKQLAEKYLTPEGKRINAAAPAQQTEENPKREFFVLHHADAEKSARISEPYVFKKDGDQQYRVRCNIDGEKQMSRTVSDNKMAAYWKGWGDLSVEDKQQRRVDLAAVVFADVLRAEKQEQSRGIGR